VFERTRESVPELTMSIVGPPSNTPLDEKIAAWIGERGLGERVRVLGLVPEAELHREYERASLLLLTSIEETAPVALGEAHAIGIPSVGTDAGGIPFMIRDGETGFVRPVGDVEGLAEAVGVLLGDADRRETVAAAARRVGEAEYSLERIARATVDAWREILG
jgi:glycosyltransferase involved in cell wall biosynthesis